MGNHDTSMFGSVERQIQYVKDRKKAGGAQGLVFLDAFIRGIRDLGYKSPALALCEIVDNSVQAGASIVEVVFGDVTAGKGGDQPKKIAVVDNGHGIHPDMLAPAASWGGTERENDRNGFGRYGSGLPSSSVSLGKKYSVFSKIAAGEWHQVTVDIENPDFAKGVEPQPIAATPPEWVFENCEKLADLDQGTVILLENLDRLGGKTGWKTVKALKDKLLNQFGQVYRNWIGDLRLYVDKVCVEVVDPLFLFENGRFFDSTAVEAEAVETVKPFDVVSKSGETGKIKIRASVLPPNFQWADPKAMSPKHKGRLQVMARNNGIHICRAGREIDFVQPPFTKFQNNDRNIKIEIDFDPVLDEPFGITTSKQQVTIDDDMWDCLMNTGDLSGLVKTMRNRVKVLKAELKALTEQPDSEDQERASETAMSASEKYKEKRSTPPSDKQKGKAKKALGKKADRISEEERRDREEVLARLEKEAKKRPYKVVFQSLGDDGVFYRAERLGERKQLIINTAHPFYEKVYEKSPEARAALEVLLLVLAEAELDSNDEFETFYKAARNSWSTRLRQALEELESPEETQDAANAAAEEQEVAEVAMQETEGKA
jgi:hypothetical protein